MRAAREKLSVEAAHQNIRDLQEERQRILLDGDNKQILALEEKITTARLDADRIAAAIVELDKRIAAAEASELDGRRRASYAAAKAARDRGFERLQTEYPEAAELIVSIIREVAAVDQVVQLANAELPAGAERLRTIESLRAVPERPREDIRETIVRRWAFVNTGVAVPEDKERAISSSDDRTGLLNQGAHQPFGIPVERREFRRIEFVPGEQLIWVDSLADVVKLPRFLADEADFWPRPPGPRMTRATAAVRAPQVEFVPLVTAEPESNTSADLS